MSKRSFLSKQSSFCHAIALTVALVAITSHGDNRPLFSLGDRVTIAMTDSAQELRQSGRSLRWHAQKILPD
ncbi:MAG: hypothetical protein SAJ12_05010 [Jaaginema sp. PMC 1079.18]|nr:hypothetical protein [Jaaginema sp. PMC 1080.18]MEC4850353.1 hypothetical protein [Jaaginema sp. PMC 1079.18]MEC4867151.1 hypothetical protein [Jaaginema sp. PMC 1078.18]